MIAIYEKSRNFILLVHKSLPISLQGLLNFLKDGIAFEVVLFITHVRFSKILKKYLEKSYLIVKAFIKVLLWNSFLCLESQSINRNDHCTAESKIML
jgi:hypothetical protein